MVRNKTRAATSSQYAGITALAGGIAASKLQLLDLRDCNITAIGAEVLAQAVAGNSTLSVLKLDENNLGPDGAAAIAGAVKASPSLAELYLSNTSIGDAGEPLAVISRLHGPLYIVPSSARHNRQRFRSREHRQAHGQIKNACLYSTSSNVHVFGSTLTSALPN